MLFIGQVLSAGAPIGQSRIIGIAQFPDLIQEEVTTNNFLGHSSNISTCNNQEGHPKNTIPHTLFLTYVW